MKTTRRIQLVVLAVIVVLACACGAPKPEVQIASSSGEPGYAAAYPTRFSSADEDLDAIATEARDGMAAFSGFAGQISSSDWTVVRGAYERADAAGRSRAYADGVAEDRAVRRFFDEERDDIGRRVTSSVNAAVAKEVSGVEVDVGGSIAFSLKDGVSKGLEKRLEGANEAQLWVERQGKAVGKKDADKLAEQIDAISRASHRVFVAYAQQRVLVARMRAEAEDVAETLDAEIEAESARCKDTSLEKDEKKACEQRVADLMTSRASLDQAVGAYTRTEDGMLAEEEELRREYETALVALFDAVDRKIEEAPPAE